MKLNINGDLRDVPDAIETLADLLEHLKVASDRTAIEVNKDIVAQDEYPVYRIKTEDIIEIVTFVGGG